MPRRRFALLAALALTLAACGGTDPDVSAERSRSTDGPDTTEASGGTTDAPDASDAPDGDPFGWTSCGDGLECGTLAVPLDHDQPDGESIELKVVRHLAGNPDERIGTLLVNPGGPGFGGSVLAEQAESIYSQDLLDHFDILAWDPRGTGESTPAVDCIDGDQFDDYFALDPSPDDDAEHQALVDMARKLGEQCLERDGALLSHISTVDSATDMDLIRRALGEDTISYFGMSYGSELGATWATLFPETVRAAVLDGAADPNAGYIQGGLDQAAGFEQQLDRFLAECSADSDCAFHNDGDAEGAFDDLMASLDADPLVVDPDRTPVTQGVAYTAVAQAMYSDSLWPYLQEALASAQDGDGEGLLNLYDTYYQRQPDGSYGNELEAFLAISCLDDPGPRSVAEVDSYVGQFEAAAPRLGDSFAYGYVCALWPVNPAAPLTVTGAGAGPIVVIGTTGDPATPLASTRAMARALEGGRLVIVDADQHTGYGVNRCVVDVVDRYLIDGTAPDDGTECS